MYIRDPVFGNIALSDTELRLLEDAHMQRMRYIRQLSFAYLVYPGAEHTRFEHLIGTMYVTGELIRNAFGNIDDEELRTVGLLHDIGVAPFSHASDSILLKYLHKTHEQIGAELISKSSIKDIIDSSTLNYSKMMKYFSGQSKGMFITGAIGSDRIDYLIRDAYHTGVAYGIIDFNRIKGKITLHNDEPAIFEEGVQGAESLLIARYFMFSSVYLHHTAVIASAMFEKALQSALDAGNIMPGELMELNDYSLLYRMIAAKPSHELVDRILKRRLFKRAYYKQIGNSKVNVADISAAIEKAGFREEDFIASTYGFKGEGDDIAVVDKDGDYQGKLKDFSPLVSTLSGILKNRKILIVACDNKNKEKIGNIVKKAL